jgi:hypothetical protein
MIILIVMFGCLLGWVVLRTRVQRDVVNDVMRSAVGAWWSVTIGYTRTAITFPTAGYGGRDGSWGSSELILTLAGTRVTDAGVQELQKALPKVRVTS